MHLLKNIFGALGLAVLCVAAGFISVVFVLGASGYLSVISALIFGAAAVAMGSWLCGFAASVFPRVWLLWPLLFGLHMVVFGFAAGFSPPDQLGVLFWRTTAIVFAVVPLIGAYIGRKRSRRKSLLRSDESDDRSAL